LTPKLSGNVPNPDQLAALDHIIRTARNHNIPVIFIDTPMPQPASSNPVIQLLKQDYKEILAARGVAYIDGNLGFPAGDPELFSDSNHLSSKGREEFTSRISVVLKAWMTSQPATDNSFQKK
jgi:lysophospholipase L1-like esterase